MSHAKNKVRWCLKKAEREGKKHRGLVEIKPDLVLARKHLHKAEHNLKTTLYLQKGGYTDWCSSTLFYTIYHCFLAVLAKHGYESRNQECTFALIYSFIEEGIVDFSREEIEQVSDLDSNESSSITTIREDYQYTTKLTLQDETFQNILNLAKGILDKTKLMMEG